MKKMVSRGSKAAAPTISRTGRENMREQTKTIRKRNLPEKREAENHGDDRRMIQTLAARAHRPPTRALAIAGRRRTL